ncbi:putative mitochondrial protein, partial [Mucuna pruriens]
MNTPTTPSRSMGTRLSYFMKDYTQIFGQDYTNTFLLVAKMTSIRLLFSIVAICHWPFFQFDIKKSFPRWKKHTWRNHLEFQTKDVDKLRYFLGIKVAQYKDGLVISQRKYALNILNEIGLLNSKSVNTPMDPNVKLLPNQEEPLHDLGRYRRLVGKLNYLSQTFPLQLMPIRLVHPLISDPLLGIVYLSEET